MGLSKHGKKHEAGEKVTPPKAQMFRGFECTRDCSGHKAGYKWAEENEDLETMEQCRGNSQSFIEGCKAYMVEQGSTDEDFNDAYGKDAY